MEQKIKPNHENLQYMGRIDVTDAESPLFIYAGSSVKITFHGESISAAIENWHNWNDNYLGIVIDNKIHNRIYLNKDRKEHIYTLAEHLPNEPHEIVLYKMQDSVHYFALKSILLDEQALLLPNREKPNLKLEFYGDSITCGACCEAFGYEGKEDPDSAGEYCNAWYSYSMITARKLNAEIHNVAQGGISLLDRTGYFELPDTRGMLSVYDKLRYVTPFGLSDWDFHKYIPDIVVVAIGQNDAYPEALLTEAYKENWKKQYSFLLASLRKHYPHAYIITATTVMIHDGQWDEMIEQAGVALQDTKIMKFTYSQNGAVTTGHIRISEAFIMAEELTEFIKEHCL